MQFISSCIVQLFRGIALCVFGVYQSRKIHTISAMDKMCCWWSPHRTSISTDRELPGAESSASILCKHHLNDKSINILCKRFAWNYMCWILVAILVLLRGFCGTKVIVSTQDWYNSKWLAVVVFWCCIERSDQMRFDSMQMCIVRMQTSNICLCHLGMFLE